MLERRAIGIRRPIPDISAFALTDRSGVRELLRGRLAQPVGAIEVAIFLAAALAGLGQSRLLLLLGVLVAVSVIGDAMLGRMGRPVATEVRTRLWLAAYPLAFVVLGAAAWSPTSGDFHGEVVVLLVVIAAAFVGMIESFAFAFAWSVLSAIALAVGIRLVGPLTAEAVLTVGSIFVGVAFGASLRAVLEDYVGHRRRLVQEITRLPASGDPFQLADAILQPLVRWTRIRNALLIWFTDDGRSTFLAVGGAAMPAAVQARRTLPEARNDYLRSNAEHGPWITGWTVREIDRDYSRDVAAAGISAAAYVPLHHEDRLIGVLAVGTGEAAGGRSALSEEFPLFVEVADVAAAALGPVLATFAERSTASEILDTVLRDRTFRPVFQPIRDLVTDRVVGYEALTRFDSPIPTERLFLLADTLGRLRELELVTLEAAVAASSSLPPGCWLSVNSSPELLVETAVLQSILGGANRPIVLEISEHQKITDYAPIAAALERLGPGYRLAVDDAGAGFASLRHILEVRPAYVKLDLGLVQGVADDPSRRALVAGFAHFARDAGFSLIAEGIETDEDLDVLRRLDVALGQGYLLGRPKPVAEAAAMAAA